MSAYKKSTGRPASRSRAPRGSSRSLRPQRPAIWTSRKASHRSDLIATEYTSGMLADLGAFMIDVTGKQVVLVRGVASTVGVKSGHGHEHGARHGHAGIPRHAAGRLHERDDPFLRHGRGARIGRNHLQIFARRRDVLRDPSARDRAHDHDPKFRRRLHARDVDANDPLLAKRSWCRPSAHA